MPCTGTPQRLHWFCTGFLPPRDGGLLSFAGNKTMLDSVGANFSSLAMLAECWSRRWPVSNLRQSRRLGEVIAAQGRPALRATAATASTWLTRRADLPCRTRRAEAPEQRRTRPALSPCEERAGRELERGELLVPLPTAKTRFPELSNFGSPPAEPGDFPWINLYRQRTAVFEAKPVGGGPNVNAALNAS